MTLSKPHKTAIWLIKRDFRLTDNPALNKSLQLSETTLPVYIYDPRQRSESDFSRVHLGAISASLSRLRASLQDISADIYIAHGPIVAELEKLKETIPIDIIVSCEEIGNANSWSRDKELADWTRGTGVKWFETRQLGVIRGITSRDKRSRLRESFYKSGSIPKPSSINFNSNARKLCLESWAKLGSRVRNAEIQGGVICERLGEEQGLESLRSFLKTRGLGYSGGISSPNTAFLSGSRLSEHLALGTLSSRFVFQETKRRIEELETSDSPDIVKWRRSLRAFSSRLHWRDHFIQRLESCPSMEFEELNPSFRSIPYLREEKLLEKFSKGETGFPLIDACMRCLHEQRFLNFRMRAMLVSFACHALHLSWKDIHPVLAKLFLDYEPGIHLSQLQMQAGVTGINTLRVYSPSKQLLEQDPNARFVKAYLPELKKTPVSEIMSGELRSYPKPIVDFSSRTSQMKSVLYEIKKSEDARANNLEVLRKYGSRFKTLKRSGRARIKQPQQTSFF